eukprot:795881_1
MADTRSKPQGDVYWTSRAALYQKHEPEDGLGNLKDSTTNYATAWGIFAALLMTVSLSLIPGNPGDWHPDNGKEVNDILTHVYVGLLLLSSACSFCAVLGGTFRYTFFDGVPAPMITDAIAAIKLPGAQVFVYPAMVTQLWLQCVYYGSGHWMWCVHCCLRLCHMVIYPFCKSIGWITIGV